MSSEVFLSQFRMSNFVMRANVGDVTQDESLIQPQPAGNCLNWVMGHLVATRSSFLRGFGKPAVWNEQDCKPYERHGPPLKGTGEAKPLEEIWKGLDATLASLEEVISALTPEQLAAKAPFSPMNNPDETIGSLLTVMAFHDAYHSGQTGVLRRIIGKPPADL